MADITLPPPKSRWFNFHGWLDKLFGQRLTFSVFFRIWLAFALVLISATGLTLYQLQKSIKPAAQRVVEDTLGDTSRSLAVMLSPAFSSGQIYQTDYQKQLAGAFLNQQNDVIPIWFDQKTKSQLHVYVTNAQGKVIFDSQGQAVGQDYSRWNDIYLTLQGKYGARSTRQNRNDESSSVMYIASPILDQGRLVGIVSVGKPVLTLSPYIKDSHEKMLDTLLSVAGLGLLFAGLMAWWLRHSIQQVNRYTQSLATTTAPHFYLGKELNELIVTIDEMKHTIENKAYVTEYVHTLTHELKSPLTAIRASAELLADDLSPKHREQFSHTIVEQSDKLQALVERLLVIAKLEQPNVRLHKQPVNLSELIEDIIAHQQARLTQTGLTLHVMGTPDKVIEADRFWLTQALQNLIDNAIKFANTTIVIHVGLSNLTEEHVAIAIVNDSVVLPSYVIEQAFDRYFSTVIDEPMSSASDEAQCQKTKGTGLGLTLVKQVTQLHQGEVTMQQLTWHHCWHRGHTQQNLQQHNASITDYPVTNPEGFLPITPLIPLTPTTHCVVVTMTLPSA